MKILRTLAVVLVAVVGFGACGGDGGSGSPSTVDMGEDNVVASSLTQAEAEAACQQVVAAEAAQVGESDAKQIGCITMGIMMKVMGGGDAQACQMTYDQCMQSDEVFEEDDSGQGDDPCKDVYEESKNCEATLGELETCYNARMAQGFAAMQQMKSLNCNSTDEDMQAMDNMDSIPEECKVIEEKCPELYQSTVLGGDSGGQPAPSGDFPNGMPGGDGR